MRMGQPNLFGNHDWDQNAQTWHCMNDLALYECLCDLLDHPPSTITVIAGTYSWNEPLSIASFSSSVAASLHDFFARSHHHLSIVFFGAFKTLFLSL